MQQATQKDKGDQCERVKGMVSETRVKPIRTGQPIISQDM